VTASQIIEEINRLDPKEQIGVIRFAYQLDAERRLTGKELSALAERMVNTSDPAEKAMVREEIVRGFYGQGVWERTRLACCFGASPKQTSLSPDFRSTPNFASIINRL